MQGETVWMFTYLFDRFLWRVFSILRVNGILCIHKSLAWRHGFFFLSKILSAFFTRSLARDSPRSVHTDLCSKNRFSFTLFPLTERRCHFRFRVLANHLASIFFLPLLGDSLGLLSLWSGHRVTSCWLSLWPTFFTFPDRPWGIDLYHYPLLAVSRNTLFLFSQWETTWQYAEVSLSTLKCFL